MNKRRQELEQRIIQLKRSLEQLRAQLKKETEADQHQAIGQLESYFNEVDDRFAHLSDFWGSMAKEFHTLFQADETPEQKNNRR